MSNGQQESEQPERESGGGWQTEPEKEADQPAEPEFENEPSPHQGEEGQEPA